MNSDSRRESKVRGRLIGLIVLVFVVGLVSLIAGMVMSTVFPESLKWTEPGVCPPDTKAVVNLERYRDRQGTGYTVHMSCVGADKRENGVEFNGMLALTGMTAIPLMILALVIAYRPRSASPVTAPTSPTHTLTPAQVEEVRALLAKGNKIEAIKRARVLAGAGMGLKEAKDLVDALEKQPASAFGSAPTPEPQTDTVEKLRELKIMLDAGLITQQDYDSKKAEILAKM